ncbi:MAG TPA: serine hydrolase [Ktedonobacterales bacterium]
MPNEGPRRENTSPRPAVSSQTDNRLFGWPYSEPMPTVTSKSRTSTSRSRQPRKPSRRLVLIVLGLSLLLAPAIGVLAIWPRLPHGAKPAPKSALIFPWTNATATTPINSDNNAIVTASYPVDSAFQTYVAAQTSADALGTPITPAFTAAAGLVQFFTNGALISPSAASAAAAGTPATGTPTTSTVLGDSVFPLLSTTSTGVTHLPLTAALLRLGAQIDIGPEGSSFTFADLRRAAQDDDLVPGKIATPASTPQQPVFIPVTTTGTRVLGHTISPEVWTWLASGGHCSEGWQVALGQPVTEPVKVTALVKGDPHHLTFQGFWNGVIIEDHDATDATGGPAISLEDVGVDFLRTLGPPTAQPLTAPGWLTADSAVLDAPATGSATVHLGAHFPLSLAAGATWVNAALWYKVTWSAGKRQGRGWVPAGSLSLTAPDPSVSALAGLDVLSPDLATYVAGFGQNMGLVIRDVTHNITYSYHADVPYTLASSSKVFTLLAYLAWVEGQNRALRSDEVSNLTAMIEQSDNSATDVVFYAMGGTAHMRQYLHSLGSDAYFPEGDDWGGATASTPATMALVLGKLQSGAILTADHRQFALTLLSHIEADQRMGVGDTAPAGSQWYMKDGWIDYPTPGVWNLNSSGIVVTGTDTYIIAIYMTNQDYNWGPINHVAGVAASLLP